MMKTNTTTKLLNNKIGKTTFVFIFLLLVFAGSNKMFAGSPPVASFSPTTDTVVCVNSPVVFVSTSTGDTALAWTFQSGTPATSTTGVTPVVWTTPGNYTVTLTASNGYGTSSKTINVQVSFCANYTVSDNTVCFDTCVSFIDVSTGNPVARHWDFGPGANFGSGFDTLAVVPCVSWNTPGYHYVTLQIFFSNGKDTTYTDSAAVFVGACPIAHFTSSATNDTLCACKCVHYTNQSISDPFSTKYTWLFQNGVTVDTSYAKDPRECYSLAGDWLVILIDSNSVGVGRDSSYIHVINCPQPSANISVTPTKLSPDSICAGLCINFKDSSCNAPIGSATWKWTFPGGSPGSDTTNAPPEVCYNSAGTFTVKMVVTNASGADSDYYSIVVKPLPNLTLSATPNGIVDNTITMVSAINLSQTTPITITASGNEPYLYYWSQIRHGFQKPDSLSCDSCSTTKANPTTSQWYYVTTVGQDGCIRTDSVFIDVINNSDIYVPNAFSPNADGKNDYLYVRSKFIKNIYFAVFNRWGEKVFETDEWQEDSQGSHSKGWDGTQKGELLNNGVFAWMVKATLFNGKQVVQKGNVTLIR